MKIILVILIGIISFQILISKDIPPCSCVPLNYWDTSPGHEQKINQDTSIVFDTCGLILKYSTCDSAYVQNICRANDYNDSTEKKVFAKDYWQIWFTKQAIHLPILPKDTAIYITWEAIDTTLILERSFFKSMDSIYGHYVMKKKYPSDSLGYYSQIFEPRLISVQAESLYSWLALGIPICTLPESRRDDLLVAKHNQTTLLVPLGTT